MPRIFFDGDVWSRVRAVLWMATCRLLRWLFALQAEGRPYARGIAGPMILAGNSSGFLDRILVSAALGRPVRVVRLRRGLGQSAGRMYREIERAIGAAKRGQTLCVFPQGRPAPDTGISFHPGLFRIVTETKFPVVPFALSRRSFSTALQFAQPVAPIPATQEFFLQEIHDQVEFLLESLARRSRRRSSPGALELRYPRSPSSWM